MQFLNVTEDDWPLFLSWVEREGWSVSFQERRLLQNPWRSSFFALHTRGGLQGFVSAVAYKESGWIGNLLVGPEQRGRGYGADLFDFALDFLRNAKLPRIWLTASVAGQPIYQRRGFRVVDRVERWVATGLGQQVDTEAQAVADLVQSDERCWGESRSALINALADDGEVLRVEGDLGLLQPGVHAWQFGPWLSAERKPQHSRQILTLAVEKTARGKELLVDVLVSSGMEWVLRTSGFKKKGSNQLMVLSDKPFGVDGVMALASLGSIG